MPKGPRRPLRPSWPVTLMVIAAMLAAILIGMYFGSAKTL